ncbi:hypothetical protein K505DRAFT_412660 [Melanomma pulvis-pyrius CBS 109.77]|uniref:ORC6 first cyclin-like domain-containing protein n=1 Tax=Melanomma pulvis-pyrius CBS 109.77 TaxID=1314802 RepID=A0A6A6XWL3_9PLEO|nr:hypothetical protein K505DRAFT_412660 [Melanomma pulvis-pyrius CBS 109.77]
MSRASIEQALIGLIPALNGPLPPELVELAVSLLARSRSVASSLKSDEEIARPYACAQLACERLKKRLNLPTITSRPPCPPRVYKKLYTYLESALPAPTSTRAPETPRKATTQPSAFARTTPKTPQSGRKTPYSVKRDAAAAQDPPEWIMPTIRALLKEFSYPSATPHIYTGVESTLPFLARMAVVVPETPTKRRGRPRAPPRISVADLPESRVLALVAVMLFYVLSRMMDVDMTPELFLKWQDKAVSTLLNSKAGKECTEDEILAEIEQLMPMAQEEGWLRMEWFLNVLPIEDNDQMEGVEITNGRSAADSGMGRGLRDGGSDYIGLGTMMQDATDYLGDRQRDEYKTWKAGIMARIEGIEAL